MQISIPRHRPESNPQEDADDSCDGTEYPDEEGVRRRWIDSDDDDGRQKNQKNAIHEEHPGGESSRGGLFSLFHDPHLLIPCAP